MILLPFCEYNVKVVVAFPFFAGPALPLLPIGDISLDSPPPRVITPQGLLQILHHNLPHVIGPGWPLRRKAERVNRARAQAFHNLLLIVETRCLFLKRQVVIISTQEVEVNTHFARVAERTTR